MSQFVIRFQSLQLQIAKKILDAELKDIFLEAIQEPLRTTLVVFDFSDQTIDKVIDKALVMYHTHKSKATINMTTLNNNLPSLEELQVPTSRIMYDLSQYRTLDSSVESSHSLYDLSFQSSLGGSM